MKKFFMFMFMLFTVSSFSLENLPDSYCGRVYIKKIINGDKVTNISSDYFGTFHKTFMLNFKDQINPYATIHSEIIEDKEVIFLTFTYTDDMFSITAVELEGCTHIIGFSYKGKKIYFVVEIKK